MRTALVALTLVMAAAGNLAAQFVTPLPRPRSAQFVIYGHFRSDYARYRDSVDRQFTTATLAQACDRGACPAGTRLPRVRGGKWRFPAPAAETPDTQALSERRLTTLLEVESLPQPEYLDSAEFCALPEEQLRLQALAELAGDSTAGAEMVARSCERALAGGGVKSGSQSWHPLKDTRAMLPPRFPFLHRRGDIVRYLNGEDRKTLGLITQFATGVSDREAYAVTDILSGLMGRILFAATFAAVVATDTTDSNVTRSFRENNKANILRMVNNGGTLTGRFQLPIHATAGPTSQSASSIYSTVGLIGPVGAPDSMGFAWTLNAEVMTGQAIRDLLETGTDLGELQVGGRLGVGYSGRELLAGSGDHWLPYAQLGIGLRKGGTLALSALLTWTLDHKYDEFRPRRLLLNFSAVP